MAVTGITSGSIDVGAIVSQLMDVERLPLQKMQQNLAGIQTKLSAWGKVQAAVSSLRDATRALTRNDTWRASTATSSDETTIAAAGNASAAVGSYSLTVQSLAQSQSIVTTAFAANDTVVVGGTLQIRLGTVDAAGTTFAPDPARTPVDIVIAADATLADVRSAINNAGAGVSASILDDGTGKRLVLTSRESGQRQAFEIGVTDLDGNDGDATGLSAFAASATAATGANGTQRTQLARDAQLTVNGLAVTAGSNRLDGVIEGVTLTLKKASTAPVEIAIGADLETNRGHLDTFVAAYNELSKLLASQTRYDEASKTAGVLQGNAIAVQIQQQIREQLRSAVGADATTSLSAAGFEIAKDGTMSINDSRIASMLADPSKLQMLFGGNTATGGSIAGFGRLLDDRLTAFLDPEGAITSATESLRRREDSIEDQQQRFEDRLVDVQARLTRQYSALDTNLAKITNSFSAIQSLLDQSQG